MSTESLDRVLLEIHARGALPIHKNHELLDEDVLLLLDKPGWVLLSLYARDGERVERVSGPPALLAPQKIEHCWELGRDPETL